MCRGHRDVRVNPQLRTTPAQRSHSVCVTALKVRHRSLKPTARRRGSLSNPVRRMWSNWTRWDINLGRTYRTTAASRYDLPSGKLSTLRKIRAQTHKNSKQKADIVLQMNKDLLRVSSFTVIQKKTYPPSICLFAQFLTFSSPLRRVPV